MILHCSAGGCTDDQNPCQNGGTCVPNDQGGFDRCDCTDDWVGTNCETPVQRGKYSLKVALFHDFEKLHPTKCT